MIDLSRILSNPSWVVPIISVVVGATLGFLGSYWASYKIEKEKWTANAAILRKD